MAAITNIERTKCHEQFINYKIQLNHTKADKEQLNINISSLLKITK